MSLIYQALKQTAPTATQQTPAPSQARRPTPVPPPAPEKHATRVWVLVGGSVVLVAVGLLIGMAWQRGGAPAPAAAAEAPPAVMAAAAPVAVAAPSTVMPPLPKVVTPVAPAVPVAKPVTPVAKPVAAPAPAPEKQRATPPVAPKEKPAADTTKTAAPAPAPALTTASTPVTSAPPVRATPAPVAVTAKAPSTADVSSLFDGLARALSASDQALALQKLEAIQHQLPDGAPARWRAEGWYAYRTGSLDEAAQIYRRLLGKLPGDENASFNLAAIERQRGDTIRAREVLNDALRHHPGSSRLQGALRQLAVNGAP